MLRLWKLALSPLLALAAAVLVLTPLVALLGGMADFGIGSESLVLRGSTWRIIRANISLALLVSICCVIVGGGLARECKRYPKFLTFALPLILVPVVGDQLSRNFGWYFLLRRNGIINWIFQSWALIDAPLQLLYRFEAVAIAMVQGLFPLAMIPMLLSALSVDRRVGSVAGLLGADRWFTFRKVLVPLIAPGVAISTCFVFAAALGFFVTPRMLGGDAGLTVVGLINDRVNLFLDWSNAIALSSVLVILSLPLMIVYVYITRRFEPLSGFDAVPRGELSRPSHVRRAAFEFALSLLCLAPLVPVAIASVGASRSLEFPLAASLFLGTPSPFWIKVGVARGNCRY